MSAITTTWKCPNDGLEWDRAKHRKCPTCGYVNMPACVTLESANTGKGADIGASTKLGRAVFRQRFADDDAQFAADEQFEIVRDDVVALAWVIRPVAGTKNTTCYNGAEVPPGGVELADGGVITVGRTRMKLTVRLK
jgi:hypothetical protein